jgi:hypothetical protein
MDPTEKPNRLSVWGHSMMNQLPGTTRKRRKREASKKLRVLQRVEILRHLSRCFWTRALIFTVTPRPASSACTRGSFQRSRLGWDRT